MREEVDEAHVRRPKQMLVMIEVVVHHGCDQFGDLVTAHTPSINVPILPGPVMRFAHIFSFSSRSLVSA